MANTTDQTTPTMNEFGQAIGEPVEGWQAPAPVQTAALTQNLRGIHCYLEKLETSHAEELMAAFDQASASLWTYLPYGPFENQSDYRDWIEILNKKERKHAFAYCIKSTHDDQVLGVCAYLRMAPEAGSIEIGHLSFSPLLQQTTAATEAIFMMIDAVFMLGYRRCEWKCNDLNIPSIAAASRYGFKFEGTFRQALISKGRNRNTAWFSILDHEWLKLKSCYEDWLSSENFDDDGRQKKRLSDLTQALSKR